MIGSVVATLGALFGAFGLGHMHGRLWQQDKDRDRR